MKHVQLLLMAVLLCGLGSRNGSCNEFAHGLAAADGMIAWDDFSSSGELKLFDGHAHLLSTWNSQTLPSLVETHGIAGMVLLGTGPTKLLQADAPTTFVSSAHVAVNARMEFQQAALFRDLTEQLDEGARGIGEISIRHFASGPNAETTPPTAWEFNHPFFLQVFTEAEDRGVPINFHFDYDGEAEVDSIADMPAHVQTMSETLPAYPEVQFIWAHSGDTQPAALQLLLAAHSNLYIDISSRNPLDSFNRPFPLEDQRLDESDGTLKTSWKELMETYPSRVLFGSDIGPAGRREEYDQILAYYRGILNQVTPETAAMIGHQNAIGLYLGGTTPACDFGSDGACDLGDLEQLFQVGDLTTGVAIPAADPLFDLDKNDVVDNLDLTQWLEIAADSNGYSSPYLRGDIDLDHDVDTADLTQMIVNYTGASGSGTTWTTGDTDGDDDTDTADLTTAIINFTGAMNRAAAVPEPSSLFLLLVASSGLLVAGSRLPGHDRKTKVEPSNESMPYGLEVSTVRMFPVGPISRNAWKS